MLKNGIHMRNDLGGCLLMTLKTVAIFFVVMITLKVLTGCGEDVEQEGMTLRYEEMSAMRLVDASHNLIDHSGTMRVEVIGQTPGTSSLKTCSVDWSGRTVTCFVENEGH